MKMENIAYWKYLYLNCFTISGSVKFLPINMNANAKVLGNKNIVWDELIHPRRKIIMGCDRKTMMRKNSYRFAAFIFLFATLPAQAGKLDMLQGKFTFDWHRDPDRQKCVKVGGRLLADFESARYRCDLTPRTNTGAGSTVRMCTRKGARGGGEYLIFDTFRACEDERKEQVSNAE